MVHPRPDRGERPQASAVIVAAGSSTRMASAGGATAERKPLLPLRGRTLLEHTCAAFDAAPSVFEIVLVVHPQDLERCRTMVRAAAVDHPTLAKVSAVVAGGRERTESVRAGVNGVSERAGVVLVHDAARPMIEPATIERAVEVAWSEGAALVAVRVRDTLKVSASGTHAESTLDRSLLWAAQTPQAFRTERLKRLLERAEKDGLLATDESALHERYMGPVPIVEGDPRNLKITTPSDLGVAEALLAERAERVP